MASNEELAVDIKDDSGNITKGTLFYTAFTKPDRTKRAIIAWVVCWGLAVVSIPIILAHYILIPAFLIAGPIIARNRLKQTQEMHNVDGECPHHKGPFSLKMEKTDSLPKWAYCPECDKGLHISEHETVQLSENNAETNVNNAPSETVDTLNSTDSTTEQTSAEKST